MTAPLLITHALLILLPSIFFNSTILLVMVYKKEHHKPLSLGIGAINAVALCNSFITGPLEYAFIPKIFQYCDCTLRNGHAGASSFFNFFLQPIFVCGLAIFQLVIVRNGANGLKYKFVAIYLGVSLFACLTFMSVLPFGFGPTESRCYQLCTSTLSDANLAGIAIFLSVIFIVWVPCSVVIGFCYVWVFILYRTRSLRTDSNLTYKMLSLPALMPFTLFILVVPALSLALVSLFAHRFLLPGYVTILAINIFTLYRDISGLVYPLLLLFLSHYVRNDWKAMLKLLGGTVLKFITCKCCSCKKQVRNTPEREETAQDAVQATTQETVQETT